MNGRPKVAVARWEDVEGERLESYWECLDRMGIDAVDTTGPDGSLTGCAGLVLSGGVDIDPALYGETGHVEVEAIDRERDEFELALLREALAGDLPVLAICRGNQLLNLCFGGALLQHIESDAHRWQDDDAVTSRWHDVTLASGSKLASIYGNDRVRTNSRHHQAVTLDNVASGLMIGGTADDGVVEALESTAHRWVVGVQWHPERPEPEMPGFAEGSSRLWQAFAEAVCERV